MRVNWFGKKPKAAEEPQQTYGLTPLGERMVVILRRRLDLADALTVMAEDLRNGKARPCDISDRCIVALARALEPVP